MDKLAHYLFLLSFVVCICAKVEWKIEEKISAYGEDLRLLCIADNYTFDGVEIKRWEGGPKQKMLTLNGAPDQEDVMKYDMSMREDGFDLVIKNVTKVDLNVTYGCTYGFKSSGKVILKIEDAFEVRQIVKPSKRESEGTNIVIICVIIVSSLVIAAVCILILLHKYGKLKELKYICSSNDNSVHRHDGDIPLREPQVTDQFIPQLNGVVIHHSNGDLPSGGPQETDQLMPQLNGFANHLSNGEVGREANEDDSLPSEQIMGHEVGVIEDVPVKSMPSSEAELETKTNTAERGNTELSGEILDDTSLKNVTTLKDLASATITEVNEESLLQQGNAGHEQDNHAVPASVPKRGFQYSTSQDQDTKMHLPDHIKFRREYLSSSVRTESFNSPSCKWSLSNPSIKQMAKAGFFCSGCETRAQCFSCGAKRCWQEGDDPLDEHFHSDCRHLKHIKEKQATGEGS